MTRALSRMMDLQWQASRWLLLPFVLLCFGLPQVAVRLSAQAAQLDESSLSATWLIQGLQSWMPLFPLLAAVVGFVVALSAWHWDHKVNHVYALSLPLRRSEYALAKLAAGAAALVIPVAALFVGAVIAIVALDMPAGVRGYPVQFTLRFLLAALLAYALGFALAAGTVRTTVIVVATFIVLLVFGTILVEYVNDVTTLDLFSPIDVLNDLFVTWAGPFHVFGGAWVLIDV